MKDLIVFLLSNYTLTLLIISIITATISLIVHKNNRKQTQTSKIIFAHFLLFNIGFSFLYSFIMHVFFGNMAAQFIGWADSPFQTELGYACLGFAVVGIISFWSSLGFRAATVIASSLFTLGAASVHIIEMITQHNFAPGNAGVIFWTDIFIPLIGFILLAFQYKQTKSD